MTPGKEEDWELESGLPNDVDAWIGNPRFGQKEEYAQKVKVADATAEAIMFLVDLYDKDGELIGSQGYSIGTGWVVSDDGLEITHPKRKNVVNSCLYGQFQSRVVKDLKVEMSKYGPGHPCKAVTWNGLGFHWMLQEHATVEGGPKQGLMPVEYLGTKETPATKAAPAAVAEPTDTERVLTELAKKVDVKKFQMQALKMEAVVGDDDLMAKVLDEGPEGFWAKAQE